MRRKLRWRLVLVSQAALLVTIWAQLSHSAETVAESRPPNVVLFLVDDLGWADVGCYGSDLHETPNVDRLARQGVRFTQAYSPGPSCSPSRAGIMTGQWPAHVGMTAIIEKHAGNDAPVDARLLPATTRPFLPSEATTIAEALKSAGYATGMVGKWHLGVAEHGPLKQGFDVAIGPPHAGAPKSYFWPQWDGNPKLEGHFEGEYLTDRLAEEACQFIETHQKRPFFLDLSFHSVHVPIEAKPEKVEKYTKLVEQKASAGLKHANPYYAAMVESMDEAVGRVLETLERLELDKNTLVIFTSDNGGLAHQSHRGQHTPATSNAPLRSGKGYLYEGGIRVPLIVRWPGVAAAGQACEWPAHGVDLFPTICSAAGIDLQKRDDLGPFDGVNLKARLEAPASEAEARTLYWHYPHFSTMGGRPSGSIRDGRWKLIESLETGDVELYDLLDDVGETINRAEAEPERVQNLRAKLASWRQEMGALLPERPNPKYKGVDALRQVFLNPPREAKPRGYWVWPHGNFDYSTIRKELEAYKAMGLGGVDIFDLGVRDSKDVIPPGPGFLSVEQVDGIAYALEQAKRLDLDMGLIVSSSWNAGGSWTPPEQAAMNLVAWQETVEGPIHYDRVLPFPDLPENFKKSYGTFPLYVPKGENGLPKFYKDVAVLAYPVDDQGSVADPKAVKVLTQQVDEKGRLQCELPEGRWVVLRTVMTNFGQRLWLPSDNSQGLSIDHFSKEATRAHFETVIDRLEARVGPLEDSALERLYLASYEANAGVIWTPGFEARFQTLNGYAIEPFLPALFGAMVVDQETTQRFLYDYRKTASELFLDNLYREASQVCHEHGLLLCSESGGPGAPLHDVPTEDLKALGAVDVMRGEFWVDKADSIDEEGYEVLQVVKQIASAGHIYGHPIVEMEAFTSHQNWQEGPDVFKKLADRAFCEGMTRVVYHTMAHNLPEAGKPGWTYQAGSHMSTNLTWWDLSEQLHAYLARASALLMQGQFVADVAYYQGHAIPNFARPKHIRPSLGPGFDYDDLNTEVLLTASVDQEGRLVLPSGMKYRLLVLPENEPRMDLEVLRQVERLIYQGATVLGPKPETTYGLSGYPEDQRRLREVADRLWGPSKVDGGAETRKLGRGRLVVGRPEREILAEQSVDPDFQVRPSHLSRQVDYIHRSVGGEDIYFVRNTGDTDLQLDARFRVEPRAPEFWDAALGTMSRCWVYQATKNGVAVPLQLPARGSMFVIFRAERGSSPHVEKVVFQGKTIFPGQAGDAPAVAARIDESGRFHFSASEPGDYLLSFTGGQNRRVKVAIDQPALTIEGPWEVRFPFGWKAQTRQVFEQLMSWTDSGDDATRAFSGVATYANTFELPPDVVSAEGQRVTLDLGEVRKVARVYLNGHEVGLSSFSPHRLDVTSLVRPGLNTFVVDVANTWFNRLISDDAMPPEEQLTRTNLSLGQIAGKLGREAAPKPSGLLGPVRLLFSRQVIVGPEVLDENKAEAR